MKKSKTRTIILSIVITLVAGALSSIASLNSKEVYASLNQPPLSPPSWIFPVVWTVLYILMGWGLGLVRSSTHHASEVASATRVYFLQLLLNILWPVIFFRLKTCIAAAICLAILTIVVIITYYKFKKINRTAGYLLIPYILWLFFALYLNIAICILN